MRLAGENTGRAAATNAARLTRSVGSRRMKLPRAHSLRFDLHISHKDLLIRLGFTKNVSRHAIDLDERVERNKGNILHKNPSCLLEQSDPFFVIAGFLLLINELIKLRVAVVDSPIRVMPLLLLFLTQPKMLFLIFSAVRRFRKRKVL